MNREEIVSWITQNSKASQDKEELADLMLELLELQPKWIMEIGMHLGRSVEVWDKLLKPEFIIGIEPEMEKVEYRPKGSYAYITGVSTSEEIRQQVIATLSGEIKLDFLFIDGDHTYDTVRSDFELYSKFMKRGSIIAFHDVALDDPKWKGLVEVNRFWQELNKKFPDQCKTVHYPNGTGTGIFYIR